MSCTEPKHFVQYLLYLFFTSGMFFEKNLIFGLWKQQQNQITSAEKLAVSESLGA